jgi:sigma-B regulation protein RsbU (phosphoserine phosphatase)
MTEKSSVQTLKFKLNSLFDITRAINDNKSVEVLLDSFIDIICHRLNVGKVLMYKFNGAWECILTFGVVNDAFATANIENKLLSYPDITFITSEQDNTFPEFDIIIPVYNKSTPIAYVLIGDIDVEMEGVSPVIKHLNFIQTISNIIVVAIENIRLQQESLRQEALRKELELASQMQNMLVPSARDLPHNKHIIMKSFYKPHYEVGGDYFDCIDLGDNKLGFCVADVSGKGIAAALLMSNFQATLRALFTSEITMKALLQKLNRRVYESAQNEKFITMFIARYDCDTRQLEYVNAGHTSTIMYLTESKSVKLLESESVGLGMLDNMPKIKVKTLTVEEDSLLISYTDGLVEMLSDTDDSGVESAFDVLETAIQRSSEIEDVINEIIERHNLKGKNQAIFDDITLLGVKLFA